MKYATRFRTWIFGGRRIARIEYRDARAARTISGVKRRVVYRGTMMIIRGRFEDVHIQTDQVKYVHVRNETTIKTTDQAGY